MKIRKKEDIDKIIELIESGKQFAVGNIHPYVFRFEVDNKFIELNFHIKEGWSTIELTKKKISDRKKITKSALKKIIWKYRKNINKNLF